MTAKEERFWAYALRVYGQKEAREAFLRLQERDGADVPMLLWCLWRGAEGCGIPRGTMAEAVAFSESWAREIVRPLRALRRGMKGGVEGAPDALAEKARSDVARTEQNAERVQMEHLADQSGERGQTTPDEAMRANIALYADCAGRTLDREDCAVVVALAA